MKILIAGYKLWSDSSEINNFSQTTSNTCCSRSVVSSIESTVLSIGGNKIDVRRIWADDAFSILEFLGFSTLIRRLVLAADFLVYDWFFLPPRRLVEVSFFESFFETSALLLLETRSVPAKGSLSAASGVFRETLLDKFTAVGFGFELYDSCGSARLEFPKELISWIGFPATWRDTFPVWSTTEILFWFRPFLCDWNDWLRFWVAIWPEEPSNLADSDSELFSPSTSLLPDFLVETLKELKVQYLKSLFANEY